MINKILFLMIVTVNTGIALSGGPYAQALSALKEKRLDSICAAFIVSACDSCTIRECCKKEHHCGVARHLAEYARWLIDKGNTYDTCMKAIEKQYAFMVSNKKNALDVKNMPAIGNPNTRVTVVVYVLDMCPQCGNLFATMYLEATVGKLRGKVNVIAKPFAYRVDSMETVRFATFWKYIGAIVDENTAVEKPGKLKIPEQPGNLSVPDNYLPFKMMARKTPVPFRTEGSPEVSTIPPLYINGRLYTGDKDPRWIVDAALFEYEKTANARR